MAPNQQGPPMPPISYIQRTCDYYLALGYDNPYRWAQFDDVPFHPLAKPLASARVAIVTTAAPYAPGKGDQGPGAAYNAAAKFYQVYTGSTADMPDLRISHVAIDRQHSTAGDIASYFPLAALKRAAAQGRIGAVSPLFYGFPTNRSHSTTMETDAPELLRQCRADGVDAAVLVPNCPVCHQSVSFAARALESGGISTVIMGCALDIVEHAGVPRFWFSDFPLGNSAGIPGDVASQDATLAGALALLETATGPRTTHRSGQIWPGPSDWRLDYSNPDRLTADEIARRRAAFDEGRSIAKNLRGTG